MEQFKRAKCILLNTKEKSIIGQEKITKELRFNSPRQNLDFKNLYIISDDEIKEGDWILSDSNVLTQSSNGFDAHDRFKKIIVTTDTSLKFRCKCCNGTSIIEEEPCRTCTSGYTGNLPQPSQQFIEKYIEQYNKGNIITNVLVEYNIYDDQCDGFSCGICNCDSTTEKLINELKINQKDNTITIKKLKDSWDREEVIELLTKLNHTLGIGSNRTFEEWLEQNL